MPDQPVGLYNNSFEKNIRASFQHLRTSNSLCDLTMFCEGKTFQVHKVVMAASSSFFSRILHTTSNHPNIMLVMDNVSGDFMQTVIDFVYCGEVQVVSSNLGSFLELCKRLEINGLCGEETKQDMEEKDEQKLFQEINEITEEMYVKSSLNFPNANEESSVIDNKAFANVMNTNHMNNHNFSKKELFQIEGKIKKGKNTSRGNFDKSDKNIHDKSDFKIEYIIEEDPPASDSKCDDEQINNKTEHDYSRKECSDGTTNYGADTIPDDNAKFDLNTYKHQHLSVEEDIKNVNPIFEELNLYINGHKYIRGRNKRARREAGGKTRWECYYRKGPQKCPVMAYSAFRIRGEREARKIFHEDPLDHPDKYEQVLLRCNPVKLHYLYHNDEAKGRQHITRARQLIKDMLEENSGRDRESLVMEARKMYSDKLVLDGDEEEVKVFQDAWDKQSITGIQKFIFNTLKDKRKRSGELARQEASRKQRVERERQFLAAAIQMKVD